MSNEDKTAMSQFYEWAYGQENITSVEIKMYKRYDDKDKTYSKRFKVMIHRWVDNHHRLNVADEATLVEALTDIGSRL